MISINWKYNVGYIINDIEIIDREVREKYRIVSGKKRFERVKWYKYKCFKCGWDEGWMAEEFVEKHSCACCSKTILVPHINSLAAIKPELIQYFVDETEAYNVFPRTTNHKVLLKCTDCGNKKYMLPDKLTSRGFFCSQCSDHISYPEKFFMSVLNQLKIEYIYQPTTNIFDWCGNYRYDFYIPLINTIVELHGMQHYTGYYRGHNVMSNDDKKRDLAYHNGFNKSNYIIIDCRYSNKDWIQNNINKSVFSQMLNLDKIDWDLCDKNGIHTIIKKICEEWENNNCVSIYDLSKKYHLSRATIREYLIKGTKFGWCNYSIDKTYKRKSDCLSEKMGQKIEVYKDNNYLGTYKSATYLAQHSLEIVGVKLNVSSIRDVCNGICYHHKGFTFKEVKE